MRLTEAQAKDWLRGRGLPAPWGVAAATAGEAAATAQAFPGPVVVKAMVPTGRRGKAGAVRMAHAASEREQVAGSLLGSVVHGHATDSVYLEERVAIESEYYLAFVLGDQAPEVLLSCRGGVEIEDIAHADPQAVVRQAIDPLAGLQPWDAIELWRRAGARGAILPALGDITARLHEAFRAADAVMLEINPLAITAEGKPSLVGAMVEIDDAALYRQPQWQAQVRLPGNPRERAVLQAHLASAGGECQYTELAGDIGLLVGGGGAGLYLHDQVLAHGGAPANHCVTPPTGSDRRKLHAVLTAIVQNPSLRGLLVGFNFAQMARADLRVRTLVEVLDEQRVDTSRLPIVIRMAGTGEAEARAQIAGRPNVHYLPREATLAQAAALVVRLTAEAREAARA